MPTTLPERTRPDFPPPRRVFVALGVATVLLAALAASRAPVLAWVRDPGPAKFVSLDSPAVSRPPKQ